MAFRKHTTKIPLYPVRLCLIECDSVDELNAELQKLIKDDFEWQRFNCVFAHALQAPIKHKPSGEKTGHYSNVYLIFNSVDSTDKLTAGVIAHEAMHAVDYVFDYIGNRHNPDSAEPTNYLLTWIVNQCHLFLYGTCHLKTPDIVPKN